MIGCLKGCLECVNDYSCTVCKVSIYPERYGIDRDCTCPDGYFDNGTN